MAEEKNLKKYVDIFRDLTAADIMTRNPVTLTPDKKVSRAKEMMKIKKISGIPIVNRDHILVGIISIEDIINALEYGRIDEPLENLMTREVISLHPEENLPAIVDMFSTYKVGRFPVVDEHNRLRGIIAREDILHGILEKFNLIYIHDTKRKSTLDQEFSLLTGERLRVDEAEFHYNIDNSDITSAGTGAALLKQFLKKKGIDHEIARRVGIATYEAETNVVIHSCSKGDIYCFIKEDRIIVQITDNGIGIEDLEQAMTEGFSTASDYVREFGFGAGMGIPNMKRFADKLVILAKKSKGTQVELVFFLQAEERAPGKTQN
ncbi:MAG: CBS domain-containing protein [Acidobacteriota bacterium]|jgi:CBS domain-containing protein/anti-sigma regulatory factor (Ser/Thr protein kinase)|nr:CBS domain-containing protein [Acidobacteriota bacterium]